MATNPTIIKAVTTNVISLLKTRVMKVYNLFDNGKNRKLDNIESKRNI